MSIRPTLLKGVALADPLIGPAAALLPDRLKYGSGYIRKRAELSISAGDPRVGIELQRERLSSALTEARRTEQWCQDIPEKFDDPYEVIKDLPVLTRDVLCADYGKMISKPASELDLMSTSGSGGDPASFYLTKKRRPVEWAYVTHAWRSARYRNSDWRVVFRGFPPTAATGVAVQCALREVRVTAMRTSEDTYEHVAKEMASRQIKYLHGYPSAISLFVSWLAKNRPELAAAVEGVFPVSEKLDAERFDLVQKALPSARVISFYGLSEKSAFAFCDSPDVEGYVFEPCYGFVEILNDQGEPVEPGQIGRVVTTRLEFPGSSLLRYDTGDVARLVRDQSAEDGAWLRVVELSPRRSVSYLMASDGSEIATSPGIQAGSELFKGTIAEYQIVQSAPGRVCFLYRTNGMAPENFASEIRNELQSKLGIRFVVEASEVGEIPHKSNGKKPLVVRTFNG